MKLSELTSNQITTIGSSNINSIKLNSNSLYICAKDINFTSVDIETGITTWKAKNLPRDDLNLKEKINHVDCCFLNESSIYVLSSFNLVLLYDVRVQKKAIESHEVSMDADGFLTSFSMLSNNQMVIGNNFGSVGLFETKPKFKLNRKFNDGIGGITQVVNFPKNEDGFEFSSGFFISLP